MVNGRRSYEEWSKEELIREILALKKQKTYGLVWEREKTKEEFDFFINWESEKTKEEFSPESKDKFPVLTETKDKEISTDKEKPVNLLIEGDNYHSLAVLNFTHKGAIDVIYIDPPYNTGNKDFKYNDKYVDKEDGYRHSKWLSFMSKRLALAKNLLKETGIIFISIDDNEFAQLKMLCDDIFGEENFMGNIIWEGGLKNDSRFISNSHDYVLCYVRTFASLKGKVANWRMKKRGIDEIYKQVETLRKKHGTDYESLSEDLRTWYSQLSKTDPSWAHRHYNSVDEKGVYFPGDISWPGGGGPKYEILHPATKKPVKIPARGWVFSKRETMERAIKEKRVKFGEDETKVPNLKRYLSETEGQVLSSVLYKDRRAAKKDLRTILGSDLFDNPKDVEVIKTLIEISSPEDGTILDFFAGSGTTGHAVLQLNKEDRGNRKFVLCTNNEDNNGTGLKICTDICYPRIKKIISGYTFNGNAKVEGLDGNLKYFKTDFVEAAPTDKNKRKLVEKCTEMLCIKENTFDKFKDGRKWKIFKNNKYNLGIIFDEEDIEDFVKEAEKISGKFNIYVFSHDDSVPIKEFKPIKNRVTLCPIPEVILKVYRKVFKND